MAGSGGLIPRKLFYAHPFPVRCPELVAGAMTEPDNLGDTVTLKFPTFTETAEMAGISRILGGYHIQSDNVEELELRRNVAREAWKFYTKHIGKE